MLCRQRNPVSTGVPQDCGSQGSITMAGNANYDGSANCEREEGLKLEASIVNKSKFCREWVHGRFLQVLKVEV